MNTTLINDIKASFTNKFSKEPLMISSPGRINIIGEHTDYNDGFVFPAAIDKGIIAAIEKANSNVSYAYANDLKEGFEFSLENIEPLEDGGWKNYVLGVVAEIQKTGKIVDNFNIVFGGDIPAGSGLSSSAALENSVVYGLNELFGLGLNKTEMILISQKSEHNYVGVKCGIMDQYASMFGQKSHALKLDCRTIESEAFEIDFKDYTLLLINTNVKHSLADSAYNDRRAACEKVSALVGKKALRDATIEDINTVKDQISEEDYDKATFVVEEIQRVADASQAMIDGDLNKLGALIFRSHDGLSKKYKVSCDELDFLADLAKASDAVIGARMMGGGFGGCTINLIKRDQIEAFTETTSKVYKEKFNKECSVYHVELSNGTHVIK